jgi:D-3-phosphoglycerate dehydrogenase
MKVIFYDVVKKLPIGNARVKTRLETLLAESDFVSLHVPETPETRNMISEAQINIMKKGSYLLNLSRGSVVDIQALAAGVTSGHLAGCALDVFPNEPASNSEPFDSPMRGLPNTILTPHIGGSTEEAQMAISFEVVENVSRFFKNGDSQQSVNFPKLSLSKAQGARRLLHVHLNQPGVLGEINGLVSKRKVNIQAQALMTDAEIGYLIMDLEDQNLDGLVADILHSKRTLRCYLI